LGLKLLAALKAACANTFAALALSKAAVACSCDATEIAKLETAVTLPLVSTVITGILVELPYVPDTPGTIVLNST